MTATDRSQRTKPQDWYVTVYWKEPAALVQPWSFASAEVRLGVQYQFTATVETSSNHKLAHVGCIEVYKPLPRLIPQEWELLCGLIHERLETMVGKPTNKISKDLFMEVIQ